MDANEELCCQAKLILLFVMTSSEHQTQLTLSTHFLNSINISSCYQKTFWHETDHKKKGLF